jgi:uncharacterized protein (DUF1800 family)
VGIAALGAGTAYLLAHRSSGTETPSIYASEAGQVAHLLRRAGFGPSPADIGEYLKLGVQGAIDRLLNYTGVPNRLDSQLSAMSFDFTKAPDAIRWVLLRMIYSAHPLEEKLGLFWHGVLTSSVSKIGGKNFALLIQQNKLLRSKALGKFDDLIAAITTDPAMLWWLDGRTSTGQNPNENYSRELMELFTMGLDTYSQDDVHNGALALTGWAVQNGRGVFVPRRHYSGTVTYLGQTGKLGLSDVVRLVCAHPTTGHHIAWRMWSFFVYDNPSDSDLQPLVDAYYKHDHNIGAMVRAMLTSPQFFSSKTYRARIKSPIELVVGATRGLGMQTDGTGLPAVLQAMGQLPLDPPNVSGWDGDKASSAWISTQAWMARVNFINQLVAAAAGGRGRGGQGQTSASAAPLQHLVTQQQLASGRALADYYVAALLDNQLDASRRAVLYDAVAQDNGGPTLALAGGGSVSVASARSMLYLLMSMPEYQLN